MIVYQLVLFGLSNVLLGYLLATILLVEKFTEKATLGLFGENRVNVLRINLALDKMEYSE